MREQYNVPTKNTNDLPISPPVADGQERTTNWQLGYTVSVTVHRPAGNVWACVAG